LHVGEFDRNALGAERTKPPRRHFAPLRRHIVRVPARSLIARLDQRASRRMDS
jgi:hypothetical protein